MIKACEPISPIPKIENNLKNQMLKHGSNYILNKQERKSTIQTRFDYKNNIHSNKHNLYLLERINACVFEVLPPRAPTLQPKDLNILSSLVSLFKKGQICFPPPAVQEDKDIIAFPPISFTRKLTNGGLETIYPYLLPDGGDCVTQMVLLPFRASYNCCPFYATHFTFKTGELWYNLN